MKGTLAALLLGAFFFASTSCNSALVHGLATACEEAPAEPWSYAPVLVPHSRSTVTYLEPVAVPGGVAPPASIADEYASSARLAKNHHGHDHRHRTSGPGYLGPAADEDLALLARFAPAFVLEAGAAEWNRIGTPTLSRRAGIERARVDPLRPALFAEVRAERVGARDVHQLVYRIHFDQFALQAKTFLSVHRNAGLLVLVTLDRETLVPLALSTVHTCGCWLAVQPTTALARAALPTDWPAERFELAGETLPACLSVPAEGQRFVVSLRTRSHRVHAVRVGAAPEGAGVLALPLHDLAELRCLPIARTRGATGSFFYERGYLRGYVKGAWAPLEGLTLGLLTLDPRLGMDRDFGDPAETGARFFTALAPWKREASRLDRFGRALSELGFDPAAFAPEQGP